MNDLLNHLAGVEPGPVSDPTGLDAALAGCWDEFDGSGDGGMQGYKLLHRMENVRWTPPVLTFVVERHGGTVCGSTRAELQHWAVDLFAKTATITKSGHRQLRPVAPRLSPNRSRRRSSAAKTTTGWSGSTRARLRCGPVRCSRPVRAT